MAQQTAVEWLMQKIEKTLPNFIQAWGVEFEQAKQMAKGQIIDAHNNGKSVLPPNENGEQYYNETFGNK